MITVVNLSTRVTDAQVQTMVRACAHQLRYHAAPAWRTVPMPVVYSITEATAPIGSWVIGVFDDADQPGALGWHSEDGGVAYGRVFAGPVLDNGGDALTKPLSVASVLSHEVLETFIDPTCNLLADRGDGVAIALEVADPVESDSYTIGVSGTAVTVSNFVTPAWFDQQSQGPYDHLALCHQPFEVRPGGYQIEVIEGQSQAVFGEGYPEWRKAMKHSDLARTSRRIPTAR